MFCKLDDDLFAGIPKLTKIQQKTIFLPQIEEIDQHTPKNVFYFIRYLSEKWFYTNIFDTKISKGMSHLWHLVGGGGSFPQFWRYWLLFFWKHHHLCSYNLFCWFRYGARASARNLREGRFLLATLNTHKWHIISGQINLAEPTLTSKLHFTHI